MYLVLGPVGKVWLVREHSNLKAFTAYPNVKRGSTAPFPNDMRKIALISKPPRLVPIASATLLQNSMSDPALKPLETLYMVGLGISMKSDGPRYGYGKGREALESDHSSQFTDIEKWPRQTSQIVYEWILGMMSS